MEPVDNLELLNKTIYNRLNGVEGQDFHIQCEANGDQQTLLLTFKVRNKEVAQVKPLAPVFDRDPGILKDTEQLEISCTSTGNRPTALLDWFMADKNITSYSTQKITYESITDMYTTKSILRYTVVRHNNGQWITCRASNEADPIGISAIQPIEVQFAPNIFVNNVTFNQLENFRVISCNASGNPTKYTYYQWNHTSSNGKLIREMKGNRKGKLELPSSYTDDSYQDNGIYVCKAGNGIQDKDGIIEQTGYGFVTINAQPVFMPNIKDVNKSTMHGEIGRTVELTVKVYSIPKYKSVTWFRGINKELQIIPSQKYSLSETAAIVKGFFYDTEIDLDGFILTLKVNNLTTDDFTTYIIQLDNNVGSPAEYAVTLQLSESK
ncbi:cell adhesion molecule 3-like [Mytilus edulis]|uniref:cell adhesion molecule 3-like n=1 Tax=Mytilus edulis TaxID=6550 RepID=UPI0039EF2C40